jgi:hypothetical protein
MLVPLAVMPLVRGVQAPNYQSQSHLFWGAAERRGRLRRRFFLQIPFDMMIFHCQTKPSSAQEFSRDYVCACCQKFI